jgi:hypothetical protein
MIKNESGITPSLLSTYENRLMVKDQSIYARASICSHHMSLDMAYLYAEPIVYESKKGLQPVDVPLDLEQEYQMLLEELKKAKK